MSISSLNGNFIYQFIICALQHTIVNICRHIFCRESGHFTSTARRRHRCEMTKYYNNSNNNNSYRASSLQYFCNIISYNIVYRFTSREKLIIGWYFVRPPRHEINKHSTTTFLRKICFSIFDYAHYTYNIVPILYYYYYVDCRDRLDSLSPIRVL